MKKIILPCRETIVFNKKFQPSADIQNVEPTTSTEIGTGTNANACESTYKSTSVCESTEKNSTVDSNKGRHSSWKRIKSGIKDICDMLQPLVSLLLTVGPPLSRLINSVANFRKYSRYGRGKRCMA